MAVLGKTVKDVYEQNREFIEETRKTLVELIDFVEILRESLIEQKSNSRTEKTIKTKGSLVAKLVPCGKECNGCSHGPYLYRVSRIDGKQVWKYLGHAD
jgi:hypothetical protein